MIDSNETGQKKWDEIVKSRDEFEWTEWERKFIAERGHWKYEKLSPKQQALIGTLYDKLVRG